MRPSILRASLLIFAALLLPELLIAQDIFFQTAHPAMKPKKREIYFYGMRAYPFGKIPQNARLDAIMQSDAKVMPFGGGPDSRRMLRINQWRAIGPFDVGGRVRSIVTHPSDGRTLWIAAADGGIWKSTDRGDSWAPIMDDANAIALGAIAVDPRDPAILYAGTGEMSSNIDSYTGAGIMKTTDGGNSWWPIGLTNVGAFSRLVVHPQNSNLIFAGATKNNGGFYRSTDGGVTWARTFEDAVSDVTVDPQNQNRLWIGTMAHGVYRSDDGGLTFTEKNIDLGLPGYTMARVSVQAAASNPNILYALVYETLGSGGSQTHHSRIFKSTNGADTWTIIYNNSPSNFLNSTGNAQGWYNNVIAISPSDPNLVIAGGIDIVRSTNGGSNWQYINTYGAGSPPHPDQHALAFDPTTPQRVYLGNDGGVYRSENGGSSYDRKSKGLAITQFYAMGIDQKAPNRTYGGTQDNGTVINTSTTYGEILGGDGFYVVVDPENSDIIYAENSNGEMVRINMSTGARTRIMQGIDANDEAAWSAPIVADPSNPGTLWHGRHSIYATLDRGGFWLKTTATFLGQTSAIGVSPVSSQYVYAGSDRGEVTMTEDGGSTWTDLSAAQGIPNRAVTDLIPSAHDANTVYMSVSGFFTGHVYKSVDRGRSWTDISNGLPDIPVNALALHPDDENIIYAGTDIGMYVTTDGGQTWASYNQGLPRVAVADLEVHRGSRTLRMASHGRSMWEIELEKPSTPAAIVSPAGGEVWTGGSSQVISWNGFTPGAPLRLLFSLDDGEHWGLLAEGIGGTTFRWIVFDTATIAARVRVVNMNDQNEMATSRSFTIVPYSIGGVLGAGQVPIIPYGIVYDGEYLWASDFGSNRLLKLDRDKLTTVAVVNMSLTGGDSLFTDLTYHPGKGHFFINKLINTLDADPSGYIYEVDRNGQQVGRWLSPCRYPTGIVYVPAVDGNPEQIVATDRNSVQNIYYLDPNNPTVRLRTVARQRVVRYGPRGAALGPDGRSIYQAITDFTGDQLQSATAEKFAISDQALACSFPLTSPVTAGFINVRGMDLDPRDSNLWVSDYNGNIYKVISCDGSSLAPPPPPPLGVPRIPVPDGLELLQNAPNPFTAVTAIGFRLPAADHVRLSIFDVEGRLVSTLMDARMEAGQHAIEFNPAGLPSGVYRYSLTIGNGASLTKTMVYIR